MSPNRSCQELSEDRNQTLGQERPGQPAVTSLTPAETIHLAARGPPWVERRSGIPDYTHMRVGMRTPARRASRARRHLDKQFMPAH